MDGGGALCQRQKAGMNFHSTWCEGGIPTHLQVTEAANPSHACRMAPVLCDFVTRLPLHPLESGWAV